MTQTAAHDRLGTAFTRLAAGSLALALVLIVGLLLLIAANGLAFFWQSPLVELELTDGSRVLGEIWDEDPFASASATREETPRRLRLKLANRDVYGLDFRWIDAADIVSRREPSKAVALERLEWGEFFGYLRALEAPGGRIEDEEAVWTALPELLEAKEDERAAIRHLENRRIGAVNYRLEQLRLELRALERSSGAPGRLKAARARIEAEVAGERARYEALVGELETLRSAFLAETLVAETADGQTKRIPAGFVVRALRPNELGTASRVGLYLSRMVEFVIGEPRESNTEGGIFPAIFGTVMMVLIMSVAVVPFGVLAAIYMHEYAREGPLLRVVRIAVNNLAGVPSIVFGVFGLGFFVYLVGGSIDQLFYPEALPSPTYGTGGILWASLTLALLTVPVVIVATEEGLAAVPRATREGSLALGATRWETIRNVVLPASVPGILTGVILAIGRAAGEVAPLMIVGMVKLAPSLPIDHHFPFVHLERKFMHLGFHIYDLAFQSPNVEAVKPLVFAAALLLILVVLTTNIAAIWLRNYLRRRYATSAV